MDEYRTLSYPITLTTAQLSFLLALVHAEHLFGAGNQKLFLEDTERQAHLWKIGEQQLRQDGWLMKEGQFDNPNAQLLSLVATAATAKIVVISEITNTRQLVQGVTHYVSNKLIVEVVYDGELYQLTALDSLEVMVNRLAYTFDLPPIKQSDIVFRMTQTQIRQLQSETVDVDAVLTSHLSERAIRFYMNTMRHLERKGMIQFVRIEAKQEIAHRQVGVLVASDGIALTAIPHQQQTNYQSVDIGSFQHLLMDTVMQLRGNDNV